MEDRYSFNYEKASLVAQMIKHLPAIWETRIRSLGWEDPLEKGMAAHSSVAQIGTSPGLGKQTLGGHKQNLVCTRTQERGAATPQETEPGLPGSVSHPGIEIVYPLVP